MEESYCESHSGFTEQGEFRVRCRIFTILGQRAALERPTFPANPCSESPRKCAAILVCRHSARNTKGTPGNVFESLPAREGPSTALQKFTEFGIFLRAGTSYYRKY